MDKNEQIRQRIMAIRREFTAMLASDPPVHDQAVFHCGVWGSGAVGRFIAQLRKRRGLGQAKTLEMLAAGRFLHDVTERELSVLFPADWNQRAQFPLQDGGEFGGSISGIWRHLSALYARACSGRVHALVGHDRATLHRSGLALWARGHRSAAAISQLKVWGFVEFPILMGALSDNRGVTGVDIYVEGPPGVFRLLEPSRP